MAGAERRQPSRRHVHTVTLRPNPLLACHIGLQISRRAPLGAVTVEAVEGNACCEEVIELAIATVWGLFCGQTTQVDSRLRTCFLNEMEEKPNEVDWLVVNQTSFSASYGYLASCWSKMCEWVGGWLSGRVWYTARAQTAQLRGRMRPIS